MTRAVLLLFGGGVLLLGCVPASKDEVVVYTALDREFSEPVFERFGQDSGITPLPKYDAESTKTVGLTNAILAEKDRPRCDLFWNNEILNTLRLKRAGLLESYVPPTAKNFPNTFRDRDGMWHGFAARARVLIVNTEELAKAEEPSDLPSSIHALVAPRWKGRCAIAKPLFGTTATHAACLFATWGDDRAKEFFSAVRSNADVLAGNKQVALAVARGEYVFGITDTDDAIIEKNAGHPVEIVYPDQQEGGLGTLFIPNTLCIIRGGPNTQQAQRLVDYLYRGEIEDLLAQGPSAQIPLSSKATVTPPVATAESMRPMEIDFEAAADKWDTAAEFLKKEFAWAD